MSINFVKRSVACLFLLGVALFFVSEGAEAIDPEWSYETGDNVWSVAISADGEYIAAGSLDNKVYLFDKDNSTPLWSYSTGSKVYSVAISADGEYIATGSDDDKVYLFDKDSSTPLWSYETGGDVRRVAISADGEYIAAGSLDNKVYLFDKDNSTPLWSYSTGDVVYSVSISDDGTYLAAGSFDDKVYLFDKNSSTPLWSYIVEGTCSGFCSVYSVAISADGEYIVAGSEDKKVYLFDKDSSTPLWSYTTGHHVETVAISADGEYIVAGSFDHKVYLFDKDSSTPLWSYDVGGYAMSVSISADGEYITAGSYYSDVYLFNKDSSTPLWSYGTGSQVYSVSISADGLYLAAGSTDDNVYCFKNSLANNPVAYWKLDESSGILVDSSGNGWDGLAYGNATYGVVGRVGTGLNFDGDANVVISNFSIPQSEGTITVWFQIHNWSTDKHARHFFSDNATDRSDSTVRHAFSLQSNGSLRIFEYQGISFSSSPLTWEDDQWYHLSFIWEASGRSILRDGQIVATTTQNGSFSKDGIDLMIGNSIYDLYHNPGTGIGAAEGVLDEVSIWNRALSSTEIQELYDSYEIEEESELPWSYETGNFVVSSAISDDGEYIAAASYDGKVYLFGKDSSTPLWSYVTGSMVLWVDISADGEYIVAGSGDNKVYLFDKDSGTPLWNYTTGNTLQYYSVSISADGERIVAGSFDNKVYLFDKDSSIPLWSYETGHDILSVAISADGQYIVAGSYDSNIYLFSEESSTPLWTYSTGSGVRTVSISSDGEYIVAGSQDGNIYLFDKDSSTSLWSYETGAIIWGVSISADGEHIAVASYDYNVYFFHRDSSTPVWSYATGAPEVPAVDISADGQYIVASSYDSKLYLFDIDSSIPIMANSTGGIAFGVSISADGQYFSGGSSDKNVYAFENTGGITPPIVSDISISPNPAEFGEPIYFSANFSDPDGTVVQFEWSSDMVGLITTSNSFDLDDLPVGVHNISFRVKDDDGAWSDYVSSELIIEEPNTKPIIHNISISPNPAYSNERVYFSANYSDSDGNVTAFEWSSEIDGILNISSSFDSDDLSVGHHNISIRVMDDDGTWSDYVYLVLVIEEQEEECSFDSFMDNIYVQSPSISGPVIEEYMLLEVGKGSYHFVSEDNVYISWETTDLSGIKLDNGMPLPSKKLFTETTFDYEDRIFTGKIDFTLEGGTYGGAASWDYQMIFSEDYTSIIGGQVYRIDSGDKIFYTWTFGDDGNYPYCALCTLTATDYYSENPFEDTTSPDEQVTIPEDGGFTLPFSGNPLAYGAIIFILGLLGAGYAAMSARQSIPGLISELQGLVDAGISDPELNSALEDLENMDGLGFFSNDRTNAMRILGNYNEMTDQALGSMRQLDELQGVVDELQAAGVSSPELEAEIAEIESMLNSQVEGDTNKDFSGNLFESFRKNRGGG